MRQILKILMLISMFSVFVVGCSKTETPIVPINQGIVAETVTESESETESETESEAVLETASEPVTSSVLEGKIQINFDGYISEITKDSYILEDGRVVLTENATIRKPDGSMIEAEDAEAGAYIQGYAENPEGDELKADVILVKELV